MSKNELVKADKKDAFTRILRFFTKADITLTGDEERILGRWMLCDAMLRSRRHTQDEIIQKLQDQCGVSVFTAVSDVQNTMKLFERSRKVSKKYLLAHHIEEIGLLIQQVKDLVKGDIANGTPPDPEKLELLPKYIDSFTKAVAALPDDDPDERKQPPPVFVFNLVEGQQIAAPLEFDAAMSAADAMLKLAGNAEPIDYVEMPNDEQ